MNIVTDHRIPQVRKLLVAMIAKIYLPEALVLITPDNLLYAIVQNTVIYSTQILNEIPGSMISFRYGDIMDLAEDQCINDNGVYYRIFDIINRYICLENQSNLLAYELNVRDNKRFDEYDSLKAGDGLRFYKVYGNNVNDIYFIPIFASFPTLNKDDGLDLYVYNTNNGIHLLNVMDIYKKKIKRNIKIHFITIDLNKKSI